MWEIWRIDFFENLALGHENVTGFICDQWSKMPLGFNAQSEIQTLEVIYYLLAPFKHDNSLESTT